MNIWGHFKTITRHRHQVIKHCKKAGILWQGLFHDLSKYSPSEFIVGAKYYQGTKSPNGEERKDKGYSEAWMHHKGRNRHHYEYWTDMSPVTKNYESVAMPRKYLVEMVMDRRAACLVYQGKNYVPGAELTYLENSMEKDLLNPQTRRELEFLLTMLRDKGEKETFRYIRTHVLKNKPFPWEET